LRDPKREEPPAGVEPRRLKIYEDLVYNNIEGFISSGFPVLHSLYAPADWEALVRGFMQRHRCHSPYFLEISQEFLQFLMRDHVTRPVDPPFIAELAHYEWVELALDVAEDELPEPAAVGDIAVAVPTLSPLAWSLAYQYPVHRIGSSFRPERAEAPTYLVVYRDRRDSVRFMEVNAPTARLLELVAGNTERSVEQLLALLAAEMDMPVDAIRAFGLEQFEQLVAETVVCLTVS
ncbi:MAG: putative DNA-binding domain-containing protein, partial [Halioglobus sp.]|nr:putative DNA-binding domain-containing protein [Halioglobus sp.]